MLNEEQARGAIYSSADASELKRIPASLYLQHPEWIKHLLDYSHYKYQSLPKEVKIAYPELASRTLHGASHMYGWHVPYEVKQGNWDLANVAVAERPARNYRAVPIEMRASSSAEGLALATIATRNDGNQRFERPLSRKDHNENMLTRDLHVSDPETWRATQEHMPTDAQRTFLRHLYISGQHEHLRDMGQFKTTREAVERLPHLVGFGRSAVDNNNTRSILSVLPADVRGSIMSLSSSANSIEADHQTWSALEIRRMWHIINRLLFMCQSNRFVTYDRRLQDLTNRLDLIVTRFCDPHHAWALEPQDDAVEHPHITPQQREQAAVAAEAVWSALQIVDEIRQHYTRSTGSPLVAPGSDDRLRAIAAELKMLHFAAPTNLLRAAALARDYLLAGEQTLFSDNAGDLF
jgi:hypothetical protein